uniref:hypothetical protein n=1 Tax=Vibrio cyclitrophicus TaxID=47951 RepID=UPI001C100CD7
MKVCITSKTLARGGAEVLLSMIIPKLINLGASVDVLYFEKNKDDLSDSLVKGGANVVFIGRLSIFNTPVSV